MENRILDVIRTLAATGETGGLQLQSGTMQGVLFFRHGELVDARVGNLTGFPAVNAVAAIRNATFSFDPSVAPPALSSIRPSERVVLKQFFGIHPAQREDVPVPVELPSVSPYKRSSSFVYRTALIAAVLLVLVAVAAVAMRNRYREQALPAAVASEAVLTSDKPATTPVAAERTTAPVASTERTTAPVTSTERIAAPATSAERIAAPVTSTERASNPVASTERVSTPIASAERVSTPAPVADEPVVAADHNLTGKWTIVNKIQNSSYKSYKDLEIGFDLSITQDGKGFTGEGRKISENGRNLPANGQTPIHVKGSIEGDRIEAAFFEDGAVRKTNGRFVWKINKAGGLTGTFVSSAARTSGKSTARKEL